MNIVDTKDILRAVAKRVQAEYPNVDYLGGRVEAIAEEEITKQNDLNPWDQLSWNTVNSLHCVFCRESRSPDGGREYGMPNRFLGAEIEQAIKEEVK